MECFSRRHRLSITEPYTAARVARLTWGLSRERARETSRETQRESEREGEKENITDTQPKYAGQAELLCSPRASTPYTRISLEKVHADLARALQLSLRITNGACGSQTHLLRHTWCGLSADVSSVRVIDGHSRAITSGVCSVSIQTRDRTASRARGSGYGISPVRAAMDASCT